MKMTFDNGAEIYIVQSIFCYTCNPVLQLIDLYKVSRLEFRICQKHYDDLQIKVAEYNAALSTPRTGNLHT